MKNKSITSSHSALIRGLIAIIIGGLATFIPGLTLEGIIFFAGLCILIGGLVSLIFALREKSQGAKNILIFQTVFNLIVGILFIAMPANIVKVFVVILGIGLLLLGAFQLVIGLSVRGRYGFSWFYFAVSVIVIIAGIIMLYNPFKSAEAILIFLGILLMLYGISELNMAWHLRKELKTSEEADVVEPK
ncbi:MAG TPA: hypothetical protein DCX03_01400 [Bacteroidales bacterium]|nr:hypothetical protein [Bacteroidales bacterium]